MTFSWKHILCLNEIFVLDLFNKMDLLHGIRPSSGRTCRQWSLQPPLQNTYITFDLQVLTPNQITVCNWQCEGCLHCWSLWESSFIILARQQRFRHSRNPADLWKKTQHMSSLSPKALKLWSTTRTERPRSSETFHFRSSHRGNWPKHCLNRETLLGNPP